jgi:DNA ligase-1
MLNKFLTVVNELKNTNSASAKITLLSKYINDADICKFFKYVYDPFFLYGVSSKNLKKNNNLAELEFFNDIFELLDILRTGKATGNKAIALVNGYINQNFKYEDLLYDIFDRKLNIGMGITQSNKALGNIIPVFDVALAATFDESKKARYGLENYIIEPKFNGLRLITIITYNDGNIEIKSYSRKGKEFTTCKNINDELLEYYKQSKYFGKDIVFDGEVCIIDPDGKENWNRAVSEAKKKNYTMVNPKYFIFDFLSLDEFSGITVSRNYSFRRDQMFRNFFGLDSMKKFKYLNITFATQYSQEKFDKLCKEYVETDLWEGLILRKDVSYKSGRSTDLIKFKLFKDAEYRVLDVEITEKPMLNDEGKMELTKCVGALTFKLENNSICKVGTGMSDEQRLEWYYNPSLIIGKQIQVKYKEKTKMLNADNEEVWSLQFPVLLHVFEEDRDF